jgi:hypothetical protein
MSGRCFSHVLILTWLGTVSVLHRARARNRFSAEFSRCWRRWAAIEYGVHRPPGRTEYELVVVWRGDFGRAGSAFGGMGICPFTPTPHPVSRGRGEELVTSGLTADS